MINCELSHYFASMSLSQTKPNIFSIDMMMINNQQQFKKKTKKNDIFLRKNIKKLEKLRSIKRIVNWNKLWFK